MNAWPRLSNERMGPITARPRARAKQLQFVRTITKQSKRTFPEASRVGVRTIVPAWVAVRRKAEPDDLGSVLLHGAVPVLQVMCKRERLVGAHTIEKGAVDVSHDGPATRH